MAFPNSQSNPAAATPVWIAGAPSGGPAAADASANPQSLSGLTLLSTVAVSTRIGHWVAQNQDVTQLYVVLDDGADGAKTIFSLDPAQSKGLQGGASSDGGMLFTGRIRLYGTSGAQAALRVD